LRPKYYIAVETRTYTDEGEELLVGIPDALILSSPESQSTESDRESSGVAVQIPIQIRLPNGGGQKARMWLYYYNKGNTTN